MENSRYSLHDDKRFKDELDECYFHPSRKYASEEIKFIACNAMLLLWDMAVKTLASTIGHESVETTLNVYSHTTDEECEQKLAELIEEMNAEIDEVKQTINA